MPRRFCLLDCEDAEKWAGHEQFYQRFMVPDARWDIFRCYQGQLPDAAALRIYDGVFLTGSHYSITEGLPWMRDLEAFLRQAVGEPAAAVGGERQPRFVGLCFGAQVLATALGGRVERNQSGRFVLGVEDLEASQELLQRADYRAAFGGDGAPLRDRFRLIESHSDQVSALPPGATLLARSASAPIEVWALGDRVLAVQGHPELDADTVLRKILPAVAGKGLLNAAEAAASEASLLHDTPCSDRFLQFIRAYLSPSGAGAGAGDGDEGGSRRDGDEGGSRRDGDESGAATAGTRGMAESPCAAAPGEGEGGGTAAAAPDEDEGAGEGEGIAAAAPGEGGGGGTAAAAAPGEADDANSAGRPASMPASVGTSMRAVSGSGDMDGAHTTEEAGEQAAGAAGTVELGEASGERAAAAADGEAAAVPAATGDTLWTRMASLARIPSVSSGAVAAGAPAARQDSDGKAAADAAAGGRRGGAEAAVAGGEAANAAQQSVAGAAPASGTGTAMSSAVAALWQRLPPLMPAAQPDAASSSAAASTAPASSLVPRLYEGMVGGVSSLMPRLGSGPRGAPAGGGSRGSPLMGAEGQEARLVAQADKVLAHVEGAVGAEVRRAGCGFDAVAAANAVVAKKYRGMEAYAAGLEAFVRALGAKRRELEPLSGVAQRLGAALSAIEASVDELDASTLQLGADLGLQAELRPQPSPSHESRASPPLPSVSRGLHASSPPSPQYEANS